MNFQSNTAQHLNSILPSKSFYKMAKFKYWQESAMLVVGTYQFSNKYDLSTTSVGQSGPYLLIIPIQSSLLWSHIFPFRMRRERHKCRIRSKSSFRKEKVSTHVIIQMQKPAAQSTYVKYEMVLQCFILVFKKVPKMKAISQLRFFYFNQF